MPLQNTSEAIEATAERVDVLFEYVEALHDALDAAGLTLPAKLADPMLEGMVPDANGDLTHPDDVTPAAVAA